jgi:hypothetical protein
MNVFVLCTGRCGSHTFARACSHITNFTSNHESRKRALGSDRVAFPDQHIEIDNRLSWFLGRLERRFGNSARYVHLLRDPEEVALSYNQRWLGPNSLISAYRRGILTFSSELEPIAVSRDLVSTINENIEAFLSSKKYTMTFRLENARQDWSKFWDWIGAEGCLAASLDEWAIRYKATKERRPSLSRFTRRLTARA